MVRKVKKKSGTYEMKNDFQKDFTIKRDQLESLLAVLDEASQWIGALPPENGKVDERRKWSSCGDLYIVSPATDDQALTIYNQRNRSRMWIRNEQMLSGVRKVWDEHYDDHVDLEAQEV